MVSSLKNQCEVPALVVILNHPLLKKEIFRLHAGDYFLLGGHAALQRAVSEFLKDYHHVLKTFIPEYLVPLIGFEMWRWAKYVNEYFNLPFEFSENFIKSSFFTSKGLLDEEKAARELLKEPLSIFLKYKIACHYFLEDIIPCFWQVLQRNETNFRKILREQEHAKPMMLWHDYLKKKNSTSKQIQKARRRRFKICVFIYGLREKNFAAVRFCFDSIKRSRKNKREAEIVRKLVSKHFCDSVNLVLEDSDSDSVNLVLEDSTCLFPDFNSLFKSEFLANRTIILYFIRLMSKEELKEFILKLENSYMISFWLLLWPLQNQFMDFAYIVYENFDVFIFHYLMAQIIDLIDEEYACQSYNYRLLLKQFWIKSPPHLKQQIINLESDVDDNFLITKLFDLKNFTDEDFSIINLILENANSVEREKILDNQGNNIFCKLIFTHGNFRLVDLFLKSLDLNQDILQTFKKDFIISSFTSIMRKKSIKFVEEIFEWAAGNEDLDHLKVEIFNRLRFSHKIEYFFVDLEEQIQFSFLNEILKWFLKTDEEIEEWKNNIVFSVFGEYEEPDWFDRCLRFQGCSQERASDIKKNLLFGKLPEIARSFLNYPHVPRCIKKNIFYLCLCKKEKVKEFTDQIRSFYEDSMKQNMCVLCLNNNYVHVNEEEAQINCERHGTQGFVSLDQIDQIDRILPEFFETLMFIYNWKMNFNFIC